MEIDTAPDKGTVTRQPIARIASNCCRHVTLVRKAEDTVSMREALLQSYPNESRFMLLKSQRKQTAKQSSIVQSLVREANFKAACKVRFHPSEPGYVDPSETLRRGIKPIHRPDSQWYRARIQRFARIRECCGKNLMIPCRHDRHQYGRSSGKLDRDITACKRRVSANQQVQPNAKGWRDDAY